MSEIKIYYAAGGQEHGPVSLEEISTLNLPADTLIWYHGLPDWTAISRARLTAHLYGNTQYQATGATTPPPPPYNMGAIGACPSSHTAWAIWGLLLFFPLGIPSLVYSTRVYPLWAAGNVPGAHDASVEAKRWGKIAVIVGSVLWGVVFLYIFLFLIFTFSFAASLGAL